MLSSRAKEMLDALLDKHQAGKKGFEQEDSAKPIRINVKTDKVFKDYCGKDAFKHVEEFHDGAKELEQLGLAKPSYERYTDRLVSLELSREKASIDRAFELTGHPRKKDILTKKSDFIQQELWQFGKIPLCKKYLDKIQHLLTGMKSTDREFSSPEELHLQLSMIKAIIENKEEILLRNFSKKNFADSKLVERHSARMLTLFNEFSQNKADDFDDLMNQHHIFRFKGFTYIKNNLVFEINGQTISLEKLKVPFSLTEEAIAKMKVVNVTAKKVITIENQTTFVFFDDPEAIIIYLAGFHNEPKRNLLLKLCGFNPKIEWFHYGDIDCGGFQIFHDLKAKTGLNFKPFRMDIGELKKYKSECQPLESTDIKKLKSMRENQDFHVFWDAIDYMLKENIKLEQESII